MASPWKNAMSAGVSRLAAGLRPPEDGGGLPVQTGFPTSLADLFLNHRDRLRKKSSSYRRKTKPSLDSRGAAGACKDPCVPSGETHSSEIDRVGEKVSSLAQTDPTHMRNSGSVSGFGLPAAENTTGRVGEGVVEEIGAEAPTLVRTNSTQMKNGGTRCGVGLLLAKLYVLVALAIGRRKLVAGVTISAFVLRLLELVGFRVFAFLKPCAKARRRLNSVIEELDLGGRGLVSPIRELGIENGMDLMESRQSWREASVHSDQDKEVFLVTRDHDGVEKVRRDKDGSTAGNSKPKKLFDKLVLKKFRRRKDKYGKELVSESSREVSKSMRKEQEEDQIGRENVKKEASKSIRKEQEEEEQIVIENVKEESEEVLRFDVFNEIANFDSEDVQGNQETMNAIKSGRTQKLVLFVLVLVGLVGGRTAAFILTVSSWLFIKLIETVRKK